MHLNPSAWKAAVVGRVPSWAIVLSVVAVVGAASAVAAVTGLARWRNRSAPVLEVPVQSEVVQERV